MRTAERQSAAHPCSQHVNYKGWQGGTGTWGHRGLAGRGTWGHGWTLPSLGMDSEGTLPGRSLGTYRGRGFCDGCCCPWGVRISVAPALSLLMAVKGLAQTFLVALRGSWDAVCRVFAG